MKENDKEHKAFEVYREKAGLNGDMHPLHLLYLDGETQTHLEIFKVGYKASTPSPSACKASPSGCKSESAEKVIAAATVIASEHPAIFSDSVDELVNALAAYQKEQEL